MSNFSAETVAKITEKLRVASENSTRMYEAGLAAGAKNEYDLFWDTFQKNGTRVYYDNAFADTGNQGGRWIYGVNYKPKYQIKTLSAMNMYTCTRLPYEAIAAVDFSECKDFYCTFTYYYGGATFPPLDLRAATRTNNIFGWSDGIEEIEELWVSEVTKFSSCFVGCTNLKEIRFKGKISQSGLDLSPCSSLSKASIESIFNCLDYRAVGKSITLSRDAVDKAYETSEGANDGSDSTLWNDDRVDCYPNWTIVLV